MNARKRGLSLGILLSTALFIGACGEGVAPDIQQRSRAQPEWFEDAKLGIFIHWGVASVPAFAAGEPLRPGELEEMLVDGVMRTELPYSEWYLNSMSYPGSQTEAYHREHYGNAPYRNFQTEFEAGVTQSWQPDEWAELFRDAGAKYVVLVSKHHDGYTLWPSAVKNPNSDSWGSSRDLVGELAAAVRARGMRFGVYYSTGLDWSFKMVTEGDRLTDVMRSAPSSQRYADYVYEQMVELIDNYQPDVLWADIGYPSKGRLGQLLEHYFQQVPLGAVNDRWEGIDVLGDIAQWQVGSWGLKKLLQWTVENQPDDLKDDPDRLGYKTTEYSNLSGIAPFKWESTRGLGGSFGHNRQETAQDMLNSTQLVHYLVDTVAKNGNVLINVGPDSTGIIPGMQQQPLRGLGEWLSVNGEAIYGTRPWRRFGNLGGNTLRYTQTDSALYAIVTEPVDATFIIEHPGVNYRSIVVLGAELKATREMNGNIEIQLAQAVDTPALVIRYTLQ